MFALLAHSALRSIPPAIPPVRDTPQEEGLHFQSVVVFTSIDPVTAQLSPHSHTHTRIRKHLLHSRVCANDQFVHQQVWMVQMRARERRYTVTLRGQDIAVNEQPGGRRAQTTTNTHIHTMTVTGAHTCSCACRTYTNRFTHQ